MYVHSHFVVLTCICTHTHYSYHLLHSFILCYCNVLFCIHVCIYIYLHYGHLAPLYYHLVCSIITHPLSPSKQLISILYCMQHSHCTLTNLTVPQNCLFNCCRTPLASTQILGSCPPQLHNVLFYRVPNRYTCALIRYG